MTERPTAAGALSRADSAHQKIEDHEDLCAVRYGHIAATLAEMKSVAASQSALLWGIVLGVGAFASATLLAIVLHALKLA